MRTLFLKIFLWFWLAIVLVAGAAVLSAVWLHPARDPETARWRRFVGGMLSIHGRAAVAILEHTGPPALRDHLEDEERANGRTLYLFDAHGKELTGRTVPAAAVELAERTANAGQGEVLRTDDPALTATCIPGASGATYVIVSELPPTAFRPGPPRPPPLVRMVLGDLTDRPWALGLVLLAVIVTGGVFCYGLARYLTSPVKRLSAATRKLAAGELTVRVGPQLGRRRDELGLLGRDFDIMAERIEALLAGQRRLLRDISRELRSPLARLGVALGLARNRAGADAAGSLNRIEREAERLNELIGQLLMLTRLESGTTAPDATDVHLGPLVIAIAADAEFEAGSSGRRVRVVHADDCVVRGTASLLHSAIENVIRNAAQHTAEGTAVEVSLRRANGTTPQAAEIEVRDHGPGVPEAALASIFQPFYRLAEARERQTGGVGLGLAITERAIRLHGGTVSAVNAPGGGLVVRISLPCT